MRRHSFAPRLGPLAPLCALFLAVAPLSLRAQAPAPGAGKRVVTPVKPGGRLTPVERELFRLEDAWATALVKRDSTVFVRMLAPDYVYSDERGTFDKRQVIDDTFAGGDTVTDAHNEGLRAVVHGATAVVTGLLVTEGRGKSGPFRHRYRFTDTWVREGRPGRWIMIASQDYDIPAR